MNEKLIKITELIQNEEFNARADSTSSPEELLALFAQYGVELTEEELRGFAAPAGELDEASLETVSGGWSSIKNFLDWLRRVNGPILPIWR